MSGYSGTPLVKKLGFKPGQRIYVKNGPDNYLSLVSPIPERTRFFRRLSNDLDLVHLFVRNTTDLRSALSNTRARIKQNGSIWVFWPKKSSRVPTDVTEDTIREVAFPLGLVDVKVCAVDEVWSGLKLVIRKELREV